MANSSNFTRGYFVLRACLVLCLAITLSSAGITQSSAESRESPQIAIATLIFVKTTGTPEIGLTRFRVIESAKKPNEQHVHTGDLAYRCIMINAQGEEMYSLTLDDPLSPKYEYPDEDGVLQWVRLPEDENEVLIRFPYSPEMSALQIESTDTHDQMHILYTIPLPKTTE